MKTIGLIILALFTFTSLKANNSYLTTASYSPDTVEIVKGDTTEYELIVFDAGFETWFITNRLPKWYHENQYYRSQNILSASDWNNRVHQYMHRDPYEYEIVIDPSVDYGIEVNWQLYWYFRYLEHTLGIKLGVGR